MFNKTEGLGERGQKKQRLVGPTLNVQQLELVSLHGEVEGGCGKQVAKDRGGGARKGVMSEWMPGINTLMV